MSQSDHVSNDVKTSLKVFPVLALLILVTVFVHQSHLPYKIQLIIELIKAVIAIAYFLHLIANRRDINVTWALTIILVAALLVLPIANAFNHINGSSDTSKALQMEKLNETHSEGEGHNVH